MQYIVEGKNGNYVLCKYPEEPEYPKGGVLLYGDAVTVFNCYNSAKNAIKRSRGYAKKMKFDWDNIYRIKRLHFQ